MESFWVGEHVVAVNDTLGIEAVYPFPTPYPMPLSHLAVHGYILFSCTGDLVREMFLSSELL